MKTPDFFEYSDLIVKFGEPFPPSGKNSFAINPVFFAARFCRERQVKFFDDRGWMEYAQERWRSLQSESLLRRIREMLLHAVIESGQNIFALINTNLLKEIAKQVKLEVHEEMFPLLDPNVIPVQNGQLRWDETQGDFVFQKYSPEIMVAEPLTVEYRPEAQGALFQEKIMEIMPDENDRRVVQEYFGAALFSENRTRKFLLFQGEGGCGKSLLVLLLSRLLGMARVFDLNIEALRNEYELAGLTTQTLLTASEAVSGALCTTGAEWVKKAVGGDFFQIKQKFRNKKLNHVGFYSLVIVSNNHMRMSFEGRGQEWRDRLIPIFFMHHIEKQDKTLADRLLLNEGSAILNWLLEGATRVRRNQWNIVLSPEQVCRRDRLIEASKSLEIFVSHHVVHSAGNALASREAYALYNRLSQNDGFEYLEETTFYKRFAKVMAEKFGATGCNTLKGGRSRGYRGFMLKK